MDSLIINRNKVFENVRIGTGGKVEDYCIVGVPPQGQNESDFETVIGYGACIRSHTVIYAGNRIGNNFQTGNKANIRELNTIGNNVRIGTLAVIEHHVSIGDNVRIHNQVFIPEYSVLEEGTRIGPNVVINNAKYPLIPDVKENLKLSKRVVIAYKVTRVTWNKVNLQAEALHP